jgi:hypothetical protein
MQSRVASARQVLLGNRPASTEAQAKLETSFFKSVCLPNGTHKTTAAARLRDVDEVICERLEDKKHVQLLDVGISSGVTTLELVDCMERSGIRVSGVGVDMCVRAFLWSLMGVDVLHDAAGHVLQIATPFFARGRPHRSQQTLQSKALGHLLNLLETPRVQRWMAKLRRPRSLDLVSTRLSKRTNFKVVEHDVALPMPVWDHTFDLIRVANVWNGAYFSPREIAHMAKNVISWLKNGGLLVICSTNASDGNNHGSVYRKEHDLPRLQLVQRFGRGFEFESLIDETLC